jgi:hypothetical protein
MAATYLTAFAPIVAPAGRELGVRVQVGTGAMTNLDPRSG